MIISATLLVAPMTLVGLTGLLMAHVVGTFKGMDWGWRVGFGQRAAGGTALAKHFEQPCIRNFCQAFVLG
jgi:hypothetical protein